MKKIYYFLLACLFPSVLFAQADSVLYGLNFAGTSLRFASANIVNGQLNIVNQTPTSPDQFASGVSDMDAAGKRYFYVQTNKIFTVDAQTGAVISSPPITCSTHAVTSNIPVMNIAYNPLDSTLYGLHYLNSQLRFATLDPATGVLTILTPNPISGDMFGSGVSDLDPANRRYFYLRAGRILTIDLDNGNVLHDVPMINPNGATQAITNIAYNWITGQIFGLNYKGTVFGSPNTPAELRLATVDPVSGLVTLVSQNPVSADLFQDGVSDIHFVGNFYTYVRGSFNNAEVISVDLSTGQIVWAPYLSNPNNAVAPITNIAYAKDYSASTRLPAVEFQFSSSGNLTVDFRDISVYAQNVHWDFGDGNIHTARYPQHTYAVPGQYTVTLIAHNAAGSDTIVRNITVGTATAIEERVLESWSVFPNPAKDVLRIRKGDGNDVSEVQIELVNLQGQILRKYDFESLDHGSDLLLEIPAEAPDGVYFLRLRQGEAVRNFRLMVAR